MIFIIRTPEIKRRAIQYIESLDKVQQIVIGPVKRSKAQSNFFHLLCDIIGDYTGNGKEYEKLKIKFENLPLVQVKIKSGETFLFPISEADTTKEQERAMIDAALVRGMSLGLVMPSAAMHGVEL